MSFYPKVIYATALIVGAASLHIPFLQEDSRPAEGQSLAAQQRVTGDRGIYSLSVPDDNWVRVENSAIYEGADLSLYGENAKIWVVVYVDCEDVSLDDRVDFRRKEMRKYSLDMRVHENRTLLSGSSVPVSYALYEGRDKDEGYEVLMAVTTVSEKNFMVEVVGELNDGSSDLAPLEKLVKSLRLKEGVASCKES
jgi:hypothetical protein